MSITDFATNFTDLKPVEITEESIEQTITVRHNPMTRDVNFDYTRLDAFQALGLLADVFCAIVRQHIKSANRPPFNSGKSKVCLQVDVDTMSMAFGTEIEGKTISDPNVAKGIMLAGWVGLCDMTSEGKFDPLEAFSGMLKIRR